MTTQTEAMKVHILMRATYEHGPEVVSVYANLKEANEEAKRLSKSPYTRGQFWVITRKVKGNT
jgi:hypothetical protein